MTPYLFPASTSPSLDSHFPIVSSLLSMADGVVGVRLCSSCAIDLNNFPVDCVKVGEFEGSNDGDNEARGEERDAGGGVGGLLCVPLC